MRKSCYYMLTFPTTHDAMAAEKALSPQLPLAVMPTLRQVSASCGISLRLPPGQRETAEERLHQSGLRGWRSYQVRLEGKRPVCTLLYASAGAGKPVENP